jgi:hypothetical protein
MNLEHDTTNVTVSQEGEMVVEPDYLEFLRGQGYRLSSVSNVKTVPSSSRDIAHIVCRVETYQYPHGHDNLDLVEHKATYDICSCEAFKFQEAIDVSETYLADGHMGSCKHLRAAYKELRAESDESQEKLP